MEEIALRDSGDWSSWHGGPAPKLTIRKSTDKERAEKWPPLFADRRRIRIPKYVVVSVEHQDKHLYICSVFGLPQGGDTRAEAIFWAERFASKNDYRYVAPEGWADIEGVLPKRKKR